MRKLAESTRVVITTVGPYIKYGEPVVAACAAAGTYVRRPDRRAGVRRPDVAALPRAGAADRRAARSTRAGLTRSRTTSARCSRCSICPRASPIKLEGFVRAGGTFSGGTYHSALHIMGRLRQGMKVAAERKRREPRPDGRRVRGVQGKPHHDDEAGGWVVPFPTIDPQTVLRSARALDRYGPDFSYSHYLVVKQLPVLVGMGVGRGRRRSRSRSSSRPATCC